jgi:hypothetical protein
MNRPLSVILCCVALLTGCGSKIDSIKKPYVLIVILMAAPFVMVNLQRVAPGTPGPFGGVQRGILPRA